MAFPAQLGLGTRTWCGRLGPGASGEELGLGLLCLCTVLQTPSMASGYRGGWLLLPQARGSSAGVWALCSLGLCGQEHGLSEHPHIGPLSQAESSAPGKPVYPERGISSQSFITGRHSPRRVPFQGQMVSTLARLKGSSLQWPCRTRAASESQAAQPEVTLSQGWSSHCPSLCSQQGQGTHAHKI